MEILIINPNTTVSMTKTIGEAAAVIAEPSTQITAMNPDIGPASIQGPNDGAEALIGLLELFKKEVLETQKYDAVVIACFDDTGLYELRKMSPVPVIGIGQAAYHAAMLLDEKFSVVTTLPVSIPVLENNLKKYGYEKRCAKVRASGVEVLELEGLNDEATNPIQDEIAIAFEKDDVGAVVLGCAGMANLAQRMTDIFNKPVIDGVVASIVLCEAMFKIKSIQQLER